MRVLSDIHTSRLFTLATLEVRNIQKVYGGRLTNYPGSKMTVGKFKALVALGILALNLFVIALSWLSLAKSKQQYFETAAVTAQNLAQVLEQNITGTINKVDIGVLGLAQEVEKQIATGGIDEKKLADYLFKAHRHLPELDGLRVVSSKGILFSGTKSSTGYSIDVSDRDYFVHLRDNPQDHLEISKPFKGRIVGKWELAVARRINKPDGTFAGVAFGTITLENIEKLFSSIDVGKYGAFALRDGTDLGLVARYPEPEGIGSNVGHKKMSKEFLALLNKGKVSGTYNAPSGLDKRMRAWGYRKFSNDLYYVFVGLAYDEFLAEWRREATYICVFLGFFSLITLLAGRFIYLGWKRNRFADEALRVNDERMRLFFERQIVGMAISDPDKHWTQMNDKWCEILGYEREELEKLSWEELTHPDDLPENLELFNRIVSGVIDNYIITKRFIRKDGAIIVVDLSAGCVRDGNGNFNCLLTVMEDVTERKRAEELSLANEHRLASLYEISQFQFVNETEFLDHALSEVIKLTDSKIGYIYFYDEHKRQFTLNTWSKDVMKECAVVEQQSVYDLDKTGVWGEAVRQRQPIVINNFDTPDLLMKGYPEGHVHLKRFLTVPVLVDGTIVAVVGVSNKETDYQDADVMQLTLFMDAVWKIVTRKRDEKERQNLEKQLLHAQKLESLGVLAGGIAHDFNNILMAIIGNADLALMRISKESPGVENLHKIEQAAARAADLAKQMLAYSGKGKFIVEQLDLNRLLEEMLHLLEVSISKKATLRLNLHQHLPSVEGDATQLRQIIMNLAINASEAIDDANGNITVTTGSMDCDSKYLKDAWLNENLNPGHYVYLEIADTGCGMSKETLAKIFDPFFTTKFTGRGLGMAAVLGIVRGHKGAIKVYSEVDKGTSFKILLPASGKSADLPIPVTNTEDNQWSGTVLLVDDEETVRGVGTEMLKELGFTAITACDGQEAIEIFRSNSNVAFVILDLTMPHVDGVQCFRELRQINPEVKVIMSSGFNEQEVTQKFVGKGLAGFIQKPYKLTVLREAIRAIIM